MIVNPIRSVIREGLYECTDAGNSLRLRKAGGRNQKEIIRAPYLVLSDAAEIQSKLARTWLICANISDK